MVETTKSLHHAHNLIPTKLYRPALKDTVVRRQRLLDLLDSGRDLPLALVMAPAGSGKTTLLTDWLHSCPCPSAWISLDEDDSDLGVFLAYFIAAIRTVFPDACENTLALLEAIEKPATQILLSTLINEIEGLRGHPLMAADMRLVLVLDDYHLIAGQEVNALLTELLRHPPQTMQLVLATRSDPALPLTTLRARGQLTEIRRQDLRFSNEETREYLERSTNRPFSQEIAASLTDKTEGWITGLHLAVLNLKHATDSGEFVANFEASERHIMDYLLDEVLSRQSRELQDFLLKTSILDRLCGELGEAVTTLGDEVCDGQAYLEWLEKANLFIIALDGQRHWYRYHHLFRLMLQNRLERQYGRDEIAAIHRRASAWYAANGYVEDSVSHALAARDEAAAVRVIVSYRHDAMNQERWQQIDRWLRLLPWRLVNEQPELLLLEAWILQRLWRLSDLPALLDRIDALIDTNVAASDAQFLRAEANTLRNMLTFFELEDGELVSSTAKRALDVLPMEASNVRSLAWMYYAGGFLANGEMTRCREILDEGMKEDAVHGDSFPGRLLLGFCILQWVMGDLPNLHQVATHMIEVAIERGMTETLSWGHAFRGFGAYQVNDLAAAETDFLAVTNTPYVSHMASYSQSAFGLASIYVVRGEFDRACELIDELAAFAFERNNARVIRDTDAFRAWLALKQGRQAETRHWVAAAPRKAPSVPLLFFHASEFTLVKILVSQQTPQNLREADDLLGRLRNHVDKSNNKRWGIETLALQALLEDAKGNRSEALSLLKQALALAEPGGLQRVFVDLGPQMANLLNCLRITDGDSDFVNKILDVFSPADIAGRNLIRATPRIANQTALIEPLTNRELEILEQLAKRLTAKEIANDLFISERTVKRHTANIYQKLGVNNRRQAVASASSLGILAAPTP